MLVDFRLRNVCRRCEGWIVRLHLVHYQQLLHQQQQSTILPIDASGAMSDINNDGKHDKSAYYASADDESTEFCTYACYDNVNNVSNNNVC
jgi:hypothetical protein